MVVDFASIQKIFKEIIDADNTNIKAMMLAIEVVFAFGFDDQLIIRFAENILRISSEHEDIRKTVISIYKRIIKRKPSSDSCSLLRERMLYHGLRLIEKPQSQVEETEVEKSQVEEITESTPKEKELLESALKHLKECKDRVKTTIEYDEKNCYGMPDTLSYKIHAVNMRNAAEKAYQEAVSNFKKNFPGINSDV